MNILVCLVKRSALNLLYFRPLIKIISKCFKESFRETSTKKQQKNGWQVQRVTKQQAGSRKETRQSWIMHEIKRSHFEASSWSWLTPPSHLPLPLSLNFSHFLQTSSQISRRVRLIGLIRCAVIKRERSSIRIPRCKTMRKILHIFLDVKVKIFVSDTVT